MTSVGSALPCTIWLVISAAWRRGKRLQGDLGQVRTSRPRRAEVGPKGQQHQDAGRGPLIDQEAEELERGGIDPVEVFHDKEHRLLDGDTEEDRQERMQGLCFCCAGDKGKGA